VQKRERKKETRGKKRGGGMERSKMLVGDLFFPQGNVIKKDNIELF